MRSRFHNINFPNPPFLFQTLAMDRTIAMARINSFIQISLISMILSFAFTESAPQGALVTHLPGFNDTFPSKHYAGYVTVDESHGRKLFYYFVQSERNPSQDPVVLWLNGGPGCSSFDGFVYEHGPFNFKAAEKQGDLPTLHLNPYSWSKVSNIIYLDSPAGVGFSYSENSSDYSTGDLKTAADAHTFLLRWFEMYEEFRGNPFFISGESFAGIYVPTLASEVAKGLDSGVKPVINFKGYMVGNGVTDEIFDGNALVPFAHGMGLISSDLYDNIVKECQGKYYMPTTKSCSTLIEKADEAIADLNIYNILEPCYHRSSNRSATTGSIRLPFSFERLGETERPLPVRKRMFGRAWPLRAPVRYGIVPTWPQLTNGIYIPCMEDEVASTWLNNNKVRKAIHAAEVAGPWELCSDRVSYFHEAGSMIPYHKSLTSRGYRALIYSGDHDMCVPFTGSEAWTRSMGYKVIDAWRPWTSNEQVAGYTQGYDKNLTFLTIKGSGHTVPEYKPREALSFYSRWLAGKSI